MRKHQPVLKLGPESRDDIPKRKKRVSIYNLQWHLIAYIVLSSERNTHNDVLLPVV